MQSLLCYAQSADSSGSGLALIVFAVLAVVVAGALAFVPMAVVWSRRRRPPEAILAFAVLWGIVAASLAVNASMQQQAWSREYTMRVDSGYFDPNDTSDKPRPPWTLWAGCAAAYAALLGWAASGKPALGSSTQDATKTHGG